MLSISNYFLNFLVTVPSSKASERVSGKETEGFIDDLGVKQVICDVPMVDECE